MPAKPWLIRAGVCPNVFGLVLLLVTLVSEVQPAESFYQGKTLAVVQGRAPGGLGDRRVRAVVDYLRKHLSGNPHVVFKYMPAGGGRLAANYVAGIAKQDGLTLGTTNTSVYRNAIVGARGVRYNLDDLIFFGAPTSTGPSALEVRPDLRLDTVEKLRAYKGLRLAGRSVGHTMYVIGRLMEFVLELKDIRWVLGYNSREMILSVERGETDARTVIVHNFVRENPRHLAQGFTVPIIMKGLRGEGVEGIAAFPQGVPTLDQYANTELKKAVLRIYVATRPGGGAFFVHKGIPGEARNALQEAFDKTWGDPEFAAHYKRLTGEPASPMAGAEVRELLQNIPKEPKAMAVFKRLLGHGPIPSMK